jgi:hypothetical protein
MSRIKDYQIITELMLKYSYNPRTGWFTSVVTTRSRAGTQRPNGYRLINILGTPRYEHRLAWAYMTGSFPEEGQHIDHIDQDKSNNQWANLRLATQQQNMWNTRKHLDSKSPYKGVTRINGAKARPWKAQIYDNGKQVCLGHFASPEEAQSAYNVAAVAMRGEYACLA